MSKRNFENLDLDKFKESQVVNELLNTMGGERTWTKNGDSNPDRACDFSDDSTSPAPGIPEDFELSLCFDDPPLV